MQAQILTTAKLRTLLTIGATTAILGACSPTIDQRGNLPDTDNVLAIQPGQSTKDEVQQLLGTPSTIATFSESTWYYISKRTETVAFFTPDVVDQQVLVVKFDDSDVVQQVALLGMDDAVEIDMVDRETPTYGQRLTVLQQLLGNIGRFTKGEDANPVP
jgi:outer membrane protein assembly factor BamE (lipoprotein component of BamABCDE complex)